MAAQREDPYRPPKNWKPRSGFWKSIMAKVEYDHSHQSVVLECPCCGEMVALYLTTEAPKPPPN